MANDNLLAWIVIGGLLLLLILEAIVAVAPFVRQSAELGIVEAARRAKAGADAPDEGEEDHEETVTRKGP